MVFEWSDQLYDQNHPNTKTIQIMVWIFDINEIQDSKVSGIQILFRICKIQLSPIEYYTTSLVFRSLNLKKPRLKLIVNTTIYVTSFLVFHTEETVLVIKRTQGGNIHSTKLDVYAVKQRALNPSFISSQHKQGRKY